MGGNDDEAGLSRSIRFRKYETIEEIIKFRLGGRAYSLTLLEFACRLGLYHADELDVEGFDVYFQGGLRSDDHFNSREYWLSIIREENLSLSRSHVSNIRSPVLRVIHKMITYGLCRRTIGDLDMNTLRELIDFEGRLIPDDPQSDVLRVAIPRPPRASMQDLYDRMGNMEIRQAVIERMSYRQSYHWDMYVGVFEHIAGVYSIPLQGAYNLHDMLSHSMISIISNTHLNHRNNSRMMMSSVEMTQVGCVTACFGLRMF
nr:hypothetical protein [Tanacetum cinerariifolium]